MKTACVILNYNVGNIVEKLVNSIVRYKKIDYIVIVDNNSIDNSVFILNNIKKNDKNNKIHIIYNKENKGYGAGNNIGVRYSIEQLNVDYILISNPDVEISEFCFETLLKVLKHDQNCVLVTANSCSVDGIIQETAWAIPSMQQYVFSSSAILNKLFSKSLKFSYSDKILKEKELCVDCALGAMILVKGKKIYQNALYDEKIFLYGEETILGIKLKKCGYISKLRTDVFYIHNHSSSIKKELDSYKKRKKMLLKSRLVILEKYYKISKIKIGLVRLFFFYINIECYVISVLKNIIK